MRGTRAQRDLDVGDSVRARPGIDIGGWQGRAIAIRLNG